MNLLEQVIIGEHHFSTAVLLRESLFLNGVLTNSEVLYGLKQYELEQLENLDKDLMKQILQAPFSTPSESLFLELGCLDIKTVIKAEPECQISKKIVKEIMVITLVHYAVSTLIANQ